MGPVETISETALVLEHTLPAPRNATGWITDSSSDPVKGATTPRRHQNFGFGLSSLVTKKKTKVR